MHTHVPKYYISKWYWYWYAIMFQCQSLVYSCILCINIHLLFPSSLLFFDMILFSYCSIISLFLLSFSIQYCYLLWSWQFFFSKTLTSLPICPMRIASPHQHQTSLWALCSIHFKVSALHTTMNIYLATHPLQWWMPLLTNWQQW